MAFSFTRLKKPLIAGALMGCGYACTQAAPRVDNTVVVELLSFGGIAALIVGAGFAWSAYKEERKMRSKDDDDEKAEPPLAP